MRAEALLGTVLDGTFRIDSAIAVGGMGVLLRGLHLRLGNARQAAAEVDLYLKQLLTIGQGAKAISLPEELLQNYPDQAALISRLARLYQDQGRRPEAIA